MKSVLKNLRDPIIKGFVAKILVKGYGNYSIPSEIPKRIINSLEKKYKNSYSIIKKTYDEIPELKNKESVFWKGRNEYCFKKVRYFEIYKIIKKELKGKVFLELGCGENHLGWVITKEYPLKDTKYIGTDIYIHRTILESKKLEFRKQSKPLEIPVKEKSIDTLIIIDMLHHIDKSNQERFIKEALSKLKSNGVAIVIEYTFSEAKKCCYGKKFANYFKDLSKNQKFMAMEMIDWIGNSLIRRRDINMPYAYRTMEEWEDLFKKNRARLIKSQYLGFLTKLFHPGPYSLFIFKNF